MSASPELARDMLLVPAHILPPATEADTERAAHATLTDLAAQRAPDPAIFETQPPFFFTAQISNSNVDAYSTIMHESSLRNYADEAGRGIALQDSHRTDSLMANVGHSLTGAYRGKGGNGLAHVDADFIIRTNDPTGVRDRAIEAIRAGDITDVSVGFYGGLWRCTICERDMLDYFADEYCSHWPGREYPVLDKKGKPTGERVTAYASIEDAHLAEVSLVYSGATPGAGIVAIRAQRAIEAGRLQAVDVRSLERQYRINLPGAHRAHAGFTPPPAKEDAMTLEEQLRALATEHGIPEGDDPIPHLRTRLADAASRVTTATTARDDQVRGALAAAGLESEGADLLATIRAHGDTLATQKREAGYGRDWHKALIAEAAAEGVRAFSEKFTDQRAKALEGLSPEDLIERRDSYREIAAARLKGGRATVEADTPDNGALPSATAHAAIPLWASRTPGR